MKKVYARYEKRKNEEKRILVGFDILNTNDNGCQRFGFYNGIKISINDALLEDNRKLLGIDNSDKLIQDYITCNAKGIIYFPNTMTYGFLEENDTVVDSEEALYEMVSKIYKKVTSDFDMELTDPEDSLLELWNYPLKRSRKSNR